MAVRVSPIIILVIGVAVLLGIALFFVVSPRRERLDPLEADADVIPAVTLSPVTETASTVSPLPSVEVTTTSAQTLVNPVTGETCNNAHRRPIAVMLSGDAIARPLSGLAEADMVFEMPVITGSITRFMAVYICRDPIEIGSVRSARHDFIPLAEGLDAMYAHWGGSHFAMDILKKKEMDNIDALVNPASAFWRKENAPAPHNGFTSMTRIMKAATFLRYRLEGKEPSYPHSVEQTASRVAAGNLEIGYAGPFRVRYTYDASSQRYARIRGGITERDRNTSETVQVRNIVVVRAASKQIEGQYNDVALEGEGDATVYRGGEEILGTWRKGKSDNASKFMVVDEAGNEIPFATGNIWVEIVEPYTEVKWTTE